jgi:hypothetical protein
MRTINPRAAAGGAAFFASAALAVALVPGSAQATGSEAARHGGGGTTTSAHLDPMNNSGAKGHAMVRTHHRKLSVHLHARGLAKGVPHAQHIHYGETARNECPTAPKDDANGDFRLNVAEGLPAYGGIAVSLTTSGDTSLASGLAVDRFPTAPRGRIDYDRHTRTSKAVARAIRRGEGVVVVHGVDYNGNGTYDFDSAGASELDPKLPAEATDPALCGVLRR